MTIEVAFGSVIHRLRKERLLSQEKLSKLSSLDRVFISRIERGKQQPTLLTIFGLAVALDVSVNRIFTEVELLLWFNNVKLLGREQNVLTFNKLWNKLGGQVMSETDGIISNRTILLVDDELVLRTFLGDFLTSQGFTVIIGEDGQDAVDKYIENSDIIDLILMDIMMPRKDGVTAHKEIVKYDPDAKILLMSAYPSDTLGELENINFIQKPMSPFKLYSNINNLLGSDQEIRI